MRRLIDTSEVLGVVGLPDGACEVCASACANYHEDTARLVMQLNAFLRTTSLTEKEQCFAADWLPKPETVTESVGPEEATELARDIFHRWTQKVRQAAPTLHQPLS